MAQESRGQPRREQFRARMVEQLGAVSAAALEDALRAPAETSRTLRLNPLKRATPQHFESLGFEFLGHLSADPNAYRVNVPDHLDTSPALGAGLGYLQDAGAMEMVSVLDPKPGELVMDLCAAPGSKSTQILERLGSSGWLVANDPVRSRAERLNALTARHGSSYLLVLSQDPDSLRDRFAGVFDKVLVDAPSSNESLLGRPGDKRLDVPDAEVAGCARRQYLILDRASQMCRVGGHVLYGTSTYSRAENSDLVRSFLDTHPEFELEQEQYRFPHIDGVSGGYWALLKHSGEKSEPRVAHLPSVSGLLRQGIFKWNGELDLYALSMLADKMPLQYVEPSLEYPVSPESFNGWESAFPAGYVDLSDEEAKTYLSGQAIVRAHEKGLCVLRWNLHALGYGKSTGDRINNLLPKILRAQR